MENWLSSVYSDAGSEFVSNPRPRKGERVTITLRVLPNPQLRKVILKVKEWGHEQFVEMELEDKDAPVWYFHGDFVCLEKRVRYQFYLLTEDKVYYYTSYRLTDYLPDESCDFTLLVDYEGAEWMPETVFYQIMPDRFANGREELSVTNGEYRYRGHETTHLEWGTPAPEYSEGHCLDFYGGDLYGIIERLDYLQELGVNALYLNPIFWAPTMHKYDALDFELIDPHLGGNEALAELSEALHKRGMKLVLDISVNHTSSSSRWFNQDLEFFPEEIGAYHNSNAPEREFFFLDEQGGYECWMGVPTMPAMNYASAELRKRIYRDPDSILKKWMKPPYSIDGWRFDVANCMGRNEQTDVYQELWRDIRSELKEVNPNALILAEDWTACSEMLQGDSWDSTMNYFSSARPIRAFAGEVDLFNARQESLSQVQVNVTAEQLAAQILQFYALMPTVVSQQMFNLIDSHDVTRLHNNPDISTPRCDGAILCMYGLPGAVNIYYGDEKTLDGHIQSIEGCRYSMDWDSEFGPNKERFKLYQKLNQLKRKERALQVGGFEVVYAKGEIFAFTRFTRESCFLFVWSKSQDVEKLDLDMSCYEIAGKSSHCHIGKGFQVNCEENQLCLEIPVEGSALIEFS